MVLRAVRDLGAHVPDLRGDPQRQPGAAARRAHRDARADPPDRGQIRLRQADLRPVPEDDGEHLHRPGLLLHAGLQRLDEIRPGLPPTLSLAFGAGIIWFFSSILFGMLAAIKAGRYTDRVLTVLSMIGVSTPPFFLGAMLIFYLGFKCGHLPDRRLREVHHGPGAVVRPHDPAVVHALGAVHRRLLARAALDDPRHDQRGLRAHRARQGPLRAPGADPPRAAQQPDPDHLAVGPRLRAGDRRRRDPDRVGLQPARRRPVRGAVDRPPRHPRRCS